MMAMLLIILLTEAVLIGLALSHVGLVVLAAIALIVLMFYSFLSLRGANGRYIPLSREDMPWLYDGIATMARKAGLKMPRVLLLDEYVPLAYSFKDTVVLSLGLFEVLDREESLAVAAHELGHIKNGDTKTFPVLAYGRYLTLVLTAVVVLTGRSLSVVVSALTMACLYELAWARFHKEREFLADETALRLLETPMSLKRALEELKYYEDLRVGMRSNALPNIEPEIERKQRTSIIETHPTYDERVLRILIEINGGGIFKNRIQ